MVKKLNYSERQDFKVWRNTVRFLNIVICFSLLISTCEVFAQNAIRRCSSTQKYCYVFNKRLVTGDKVSIVNEKNQLVAIGEISDML